MTKCAVYGCESDAFYPHTLRQPPQGLFDFPAEVTVCGVHRDELSQPDTEWMMRDSDEGWTELRTGYKLRELNEYILLEPPAGFRIHGASRDFSSPDDTGVHLSLQVRRRGGEPETMTLVIPIRHIAEFGRRVQIMAERLEPRPGSPTEQS
jgi:hypothetical protein